MRRQVLGIRLLALALALGFALHAGAGADRPASRVGSVGGDAAAASFGRGNDSLLAQQSDAERADRAAANRQQALREWRERADAYDNQRALTQFESVFSDLWAKLEATSAVQSLDPRTFSGDLAGRPRQLFEEAVADTQRLFKAQDAARAIRPEAWTALREQRIRLDAESLVLGESREFYKRALPQQLCTSDDETSSFRVCRGAGIEAVCSSLRELTSQSVGNVARSSSSFTSKAEGLIAGIRGKLDECERAVTEIAGKGSNVRLAGIPVSLGLEFERGRLLTVTVLPLEDSHLIERWFSAKFGEASLDRVVRTGGGVPFAALCDGYGGCSIAATRQETQVSETRTWRSGVLRVVRSNGNAFVVELLDPTKRAWLDVGRMK